MATKLKALEVTYNGEAYEVDSLTDEQVEQITKAYASRVDIETEGDTVSKISIYYGGK